MNVNEVAQCVMPINPDFRDGSIATVSGVSGHVRFTPGGDRIADIAGGPVRATNRPLPSHISLHCRPVVTQSIDPSQQSTPWALLLDSKRFPHRKSLHARNEEMTHGQ